MGAFATSCYRIMLNIKCLDDEHPACHQHCMAVPLITKGTVHPNIPENEPYAGDMPSMFKIIMAEVMMII